MSKKAVFLGIDAGTTKIKASLYDLDLNEIGTVSKNVVIYSPSPGASEIDMDELWENLCSITNELKANHGNVWSNIAGVGITGQGDGLWPINQEGQPVCRAMLWNDTRSKELHIENIPGLDDLLKKECANNIYPGSMPALQKWLKINNPEIYRAIHTSLHCKDWLNYKLTGVIVSDYSDITCSSGMNMKTLEYIPELYELLDIQEAYTTMPRAVEPTDTIGYITKEASEFSGIPEGVPVIAGCLDCTAVFTGTDFYRPYEACTIIGTAMISGVCLDIDGINPNDLRGLLTYHAVKGRYVKIMNTAGGSSSIDIIKNLLCPNDSYEDMFKQIEKVPLGSRGLLFHPYLFGERAPFKNPFAFASFFGIRSYHTKYDLMRAAYEGLAMSFLDCYRHVNNIEKLYLCGGTSASPFICQMFSDAIGLPTKRQKINELGTLGIVKILQVGLGYAQSFESLELDSYNEYYPNAESHEAYANLYDKFVSYRESIQPHWVDKK